MKLQTTTSTTTFTSPETTTSSLDFIQKYFPQSLPYSHTLEKKVEKVVKNPSNKLFVNMPKKSAGKEVLQDTTILVAIIVSSISCFLIIFIGISIFINREDKTDIESYSTGSTSSNSTYLQNQSGCEKPVSYVLGDDGQIYQTIDFPDQCQYFFTNYGQNNQKLWQPKYADFFVTLLL